MRNASSVFPQHSTPLFVDARSRRVIEQLDRVAPSEASILIVGETGTGKEVIARQIHERSGRSGPFVAVNCGALSETLGEAALFGHEAGAYTGANGARAGWFEAANGGTLFLDEVGDLPLSLQVALLRVLQERQVVRLGSRKALPLDVRVVAATNIDVSQAVGSGKFRLDLYFRLSVVNLELPPLRERVADILPLAQHFIDLYSDRLQQDAPVLDSDARNALVNYSWPGNVRELENVLHGAVLVSVDGVIRRSDLRLLSWLTSTSSSSAAAKPAPRVAAVEAIESSLEGALAPQLDRLFIQGEERLFESLESLVIHRAMSHCKGNQVHTAKLLGISRNVLRTYLKRFGLIGAEATANETPERTTIHVTTSRNAASSFTRYPVHYRSEPVGEIA